MKIDNIVNDCIEASLIGMASSVIWKVLIPEVVHVAAGVTTALIAAIAVFFVQRYLRKRFPDNPNK